METKKLFFILFGFSILDLLTTFIGLNFGNNLSESNPISAYFFSMGLYGWILWAFIIGVSLFSFSYFINYLESRHIENYSNERLASLIHLSVIVFWTIVQSHTIISNIRIVL